MLIVGLFAISDSLTVSLLTFFLEGMMNHFDLRPYVFLDNVKPTKSKLAVPPARQVVFVFNSDNSSPRGVKNSCRSSFDFNATSVVLARITMSSAYLTNIIYLESSLILW